MIFSDIVQLLKVHFKRLPTEKILRNLPKKTKKFKKSFGARFELLNARIELLHIISDLFLLRYIYCNINMRMYRG